MVFRRGYTVSFVLILLIIVGASGVFYFTSSPKSVVSLSPENDGLHLECMNDCGNVTYTNSSCQIRCRYVLGEGPDLCDTFGSICAT